MSASEPREFFGEYRAAFARYDAEALADLFAFPLHVVSDSEEVTPTSVASRRDWRASSNGCSAPTECSAWPALNRSSWTSWG